MVRRNIRVAAWILVFAPGAPQRKTEPEGAPGDMAGQMRAAYTNIQRTLAANCADFETIVKESIFTTDKDALLKASDVRFEYYDKERLPATSWVQVQRLVDPGFLVQIEVVAELP